MPTTKPSRQMGSSPKGQGRLMKPKHLPPRFRREGCVSARAVIGRNPDEVTIFVHCTDHGGPSEGNITVVRYVLAARGTGTNIVAYRLESPGFNRTQCHQSTQLITCYVYGRRSGILKMTIQVPPRTRCSDGISVGTRRERSCAPKPCFGTVSVYSLFEGRPRAC